MSGPRPTGFRRASWIVIGALVVVSLVRAATDDGSPRTTADKVEAIAKTLKCPVCDGQSVADSDVAASRAIRVEIARLVEQGRSTSEVRSTIAATYGDQVQLTPPASGLAGLVWMLPVVALVVALAALAAAFTRWRRRDAAGVTDEDRVLVERALRDR